MQKRPFVTRERLEAIAAEYPTPFYLYDESEIRRRAAELSAAFSWNPGFKEYFAVKATPNPAILRILAECGCGCDCATGVELLLADRAGVTGRDIMLSSNDTPDEDFRAADERGAIINLDGPDMVACLRRALGGRVPRTVCCRVNPGGTFESANGIIGSPADSKFGMTPAQLEAAFAELAALGVEEFGIHAFLASNTQVNDYYPRLARQLFEMAVDLSARLGVRIGFVDLSGGIGVAYHPDDTPCDLAVIGEGVRQAYEEVLVPAGMDDVAICTEMGRFMMGPYGCLVTRAQHEKRIYKDYLGVDASAVDLIRPAMYGAYHHITVMGQAGGPDKSSWPASRTYDVTGNLCENNDKFAVDRSLPEVVRGDLLVIHDTGAHGYSMGYNYNGRLRSAEVLLREDGSTELIRRAETPSDYFATLDFGDSNGDRPLLNHEQQ